MIRLCEVVRNFGSVRAVRGVSFEIPAGQVVGILGPNGAGKTTTIRMLTGTLPPSSGQALIDGMDSVDASRQVRSRLGYLPENAPLYGEMRVEGYLRYRAGLYGMRGDARRKAIGHAMDRCRISDVSRRRIGHLSKGYRQRVGLAAALVHDPPVLILDEPTTGLDPSQIAETRGLIRELAGDRTMLLVSHILPEVQRSCDRIIIFARGKVRADGAPADLIAGVRGDVRCIVEARATEALDAQLRGLSGVSAVESTAMADGWRRSIITVGEKAAKREDPRAMIGAACAAAGATLRELRAETASLEELYIRIVESADAEREGDNAGVDG